MSNWVKTGGRGEDKCAFPPQFTCLWSHWILGKEFKQGMHLAMVNWFLIHSTNIYWMLTMHEDGNIKPNMTSEGHSGLSDKQWFFEKSKLKTFITECIWLNCLRLLPHLYILREQVHRSAANSFLESTTNIKQLFCFVAMSNYDGSKTIPYHSIILSLCWRLVNQYNLIFLCKQLVEKPNSAANFQNVLKLMSMSQ